MSKRSLKTSNCDQLEPVGAPAELTTDASTLTPVNEVDVAELAYQRWVERGCPQGCPEDDWYDVPPSPTVDGIGSEHGAAAFRRVAEAVRSLYAHTGRLLQSVKSSAKHT
jgi:hypothetical protein